MNPAFTVIWFAMTLLACGACNRSNTATAKQLLNVSYDPTRELYQDINAAFIKSWQREHKTMVSIDQSHGGSGKQARAVIDGLEADVVTLALAYDIDAISRKAKLLPTDWQSQLPHHSTPYTSTIVFVVHKGNPHHIVDWNDLTKANIKVITPNPKTSGGARWNYLAAWGYALKKSRGDASEAKNFVRRLYKNVPVLDSGARGATTTFAQHGIGDVLIAWENEAFLLTKELGKDKFEIVVPSISILAEPPVAVVQKNAKKHGTLSLANAYLAFLYTEPAQQIAAKHYYRPRLESVAKKYASVFATVSLFTVDDMFGGWQAAQAAHFDDGGSFDQIYQQNR